MRASSQSLGTSKLTVNWEKPTSTAISPESIGTFMFIGRERDVEALKKKTDSQERFWNGKNRCRLRDQRCWNVHFGARSCSRPVV